MCAGSGEQVQVSMWSMQGWSSSVRGVEVRRRLTGSREWEEVSMSSIRGMSSSVCGSEVRRRGDASGRRLALARSILMPTRARLSLGRNSPDASASAGSIPVPLRGLNVRWRLRGFGNDGSFSGI